jgi:predicted O-methyltransferase YrrM
MHDLISALRPKLRREPPASPSGQQLPHYDVTAFAADIDLADLDVVKWAPVWMTRAERLLLYTLAFCLRPRRYLEIGTLKGGSALLVNAALTSLQAEGRLVCVDPKPEIEPEHWKILEPRTTLLTGYSPDILARACEAAGGQFDFILIDGDHSYQGVLRDARGVLPYAADGAYILCHDSFFADVARGIDEVVKQHAPEIVDFGTLTREVTVQTDSAGRAVEWGGLRLLQVRRGKVAARK